MKFKAKIVVDVEFEANEMDDAESIAESWNAGIFYFIGAGDRNILGEPKVTVKPVGRQKAK